MNEFALIEKYFQRAELFHPESVKLSIGDDCAILNTEKQIVTTTDNQVPGIHFLADTLPADIAWRALAVSLSDIAAMGAKPTSVLLALTMPAVDEAWLQGFSDGFFALADQCQVDLIGGNVSQGPLNICVTAFGEISKGQAILRSGAKASELVFVSGELGLAALGLQGKPGKYRDKYLRPMPRIALGQALQGIASSMIDISDGLLADLQHIIDLSQVGIEIDLAKVPGIDDKLLAVSHGDDYELAFTVPANQSGQVLALAEQLQIPLTEIGVVLGEQLVVKHGLSQVDYSNSGYKHFAASSVANQTKNR